MSTVGGEVLRRALSDLGRANATGRLVLHDSASHEACVEFEEGAVIGIQMQDQRPRLGMRLVAAGMLTPEQLAAALVVQRQGVGEGVEARRIGDILVERGAVARGVVEHVARTQMADNLASLLASPFEPPKFEPRNRSGKCVPSADAAVAVDRLLADADARRPVLLKLLGQLGGPGCVPELVGVPTVDPNPTLGPHDWALLCKIDGVRTLAELGSSCGFTMLEAAQILDGLISVGVASVGRTVQPGRLENVDTAALLRELSGLALASPARTRRGATAQAATSK